jgi:hypothetical protein
MTGAMADLQRPSLKWLLQELRIEDKGKGKGQARRSKTFLFRRTRTVIEYLPENRIFYVKDEAIPSR